MFKKFILDWLVKPKKLQPSEEKDPLLCEIIPSDDKYRLVSQRLIEGCNTIRDYEIRREFYGFLVKTGDDYDKAFEDEKGDHGPYGLDYSESRAYSECSCINMNIFNNIHEEIPPLGTKDASIFNLLEEDIHKNY